MPNVSDADGGGVTPASARARARRALLVCAGLLVAIALLAGATSLPAACASCHAMTPYARAVTASAHKGVDCYACHLARGPWGFAAQKADEWFRMYPAAAFGGTKVDGPGARVERSSCLACHPRVLDGAVAPGRIRIAHVTCAVAQACDSCHGGVAHGKSTRWVRSYSMDECVACHRATRGAPVMCDSCHTGRGERERLATGPWQVTHGPMWRQTHGMGAIRYCATCHPDSYCVKCHGTPLPHPVDFGHTHGPDSLRRGSKCAECHSQGYCDGCHGIAMPHPAGFLPAHDKVAKRPDDPVCLRCHSDKDCTGCHQRHAHPARSSDGRTLPQPKTGVR